MLFTVVFDLCIIATCLGLFGIDLLLLDLGVLLFVIVCLLCVLF